MTSPQSVGAVQAEMHENWQAANARLWGGGVPVGGPTVGFHVPDVVVGAMKDAWGVPVNLLSVASPKVIISLVAAKHGVTAADIVGPSRTRKIVAARHEAIGVVYTHCRQVSLPAIGRLFNRDHTTILHALRKLRRISKPAPYRRAKFLTKEMQTKPEKIVAQKKRHEHLEDRHFNEAVN